LDIIQLLLLKLLHDYTFLGPKILKIKPKTTQHLKLQLPHQVESSVDSIVRRHKSANRKSFLNSASEDENDTANEEPKVTRSAKRANIPDGDYPYRCYLNTLLYPSVTRLDSIANGLGIKQNGSSHDAVEDVDVPGTLMRVRFTLK